MMYNPTIRSQNSTRWVHQDLGHTPVPSVDYEVLSGLLKTAMEPEVQDAIEDGTINAPAPVVNDNGPSDNTQIDYGAGVQSPAPGQDADSIQAMRLAGYNVRDLRTHAKGFSIDDIVDRSKDVKELDKNSIVPIPGMMMTYDNDDSTEAPITSDWIAPQGPFWNSYDNT